MPTTREVLTIRPSQPTIEGAGVKLRRAFGAADERLDPFLLLDDFGSDDPADFQAGFPWHPHRGIETVTYVLEGRVQHGDSLGNSGVIGAGDVQWMTAGSGIIHEEMPDPSGPLRGFQLWSNLPADKKMIPPRYQGIRAAEIPTVELAEGVTAKVICGQAGGVDGPVDEVAASPLYLDITVEAGRRHRHPAPQGHNAFAYVVAGRGRFGGDEAEAQRLVIFSDDHELEIEAGDEGVRLLLVAGRPLREPVAWGGPIVMNTREELRAAFEEYRGGTFIKHS